MAKLTRNKTKDTTCFYCGTKAVNATTEKNMKVCCCYCLQNNKGIVTQFYRNETDKKKDEE